MNANAQDSPGLVTLPTYAAGTVADHLEGIVMTLLSGAGGVAISGVFDAASVAEARGLLMEHSDHEGDKVTHFQGANPDKLNLQRRVWNLLNKGTIFETMVQQPEVLAVASAFLGDEFHLGSIAANRLLPGGPGQEPHIDYPYWDLYNSSSFPVNINSSFPMNLQATILMDDFTPENGATTFVPFSQNDLNYPTDRELFDRDAIRQTGSAGDVVIFNGMCWHCAMPNESDADRTGVLIEYLPKFVRPLEDHRVVKAEVIERATPMLRQLLGLDYPYPQVLDEAEAGNAEGIARSRGDLRVGIFGTSWWADSMYLPAVEGFDGASVVAACGRNADRANAFARQWNIEVATTNPDELLSQQLDAVIIASANESHYPLTMAALERGLPVLCEKPLAQTYSQAAEMADRAVQADVATFVPFTYRYMPTNQYVKRLVDDGFLGTPYHLNLRYFTGYAREPGYNWRFDKELAGSGVLGDLGSHWLHVARWLFGEVTEIGAITQVFRQRPNRPNGDDYERAEDSALMTVRFANGAYGSLQTSAVCWEGTAFNQTHHLDAHGSNGTLYSLNDWDTVQEVRGLVANEPGPSVIMPIPDAHWSGARRDTVHHTYKDVFRTTGAMIGEFLTAVREGTRCEPDFAEGARVQQLLELAVASAARDGCLLPA